MKLDQTRLAAAAQGAQDRARQMIDVARERAAAGQIGRAPSTAVTPGRPVQRWVIGGNPIEGAGRGS